MITISGDEVAASLSYPELIAALKEAFKKPPTVPQRQHFNYRNPGETEDSTLLVMPAWTSGEYCGVKIVSVNPLNTQRALPAIHGQYLLSSAVTGEPKALIDAQALTRIRTAATSALASSLLSKPDSTKMLMMGTGALAPELIRAHCSVRPIDGVYVWGRNHEKSNDLVRYLNIAGVGLQAVADANEVIHDMDIISSATLSSDPLIHGKQVNTGTHVDLVGSYRPDMREGDNDLIARSKIFVDSRESACEESGDLAIPIIEGVISKDDIIADLFELSRDQIKFERRPEDISWFKSVGHALEDYVAASMVYRHFHSKLESPLT